MAERALHDAAMQHPNPMIASSLLVLRRRIMNARDAYDDHAPRD